MRPATTIVLALLLIALFGAAIYQLFFLKTSPVSGGSTTGLVRTLLAR